MVEDVSIPLTAHANPHWRGIAGHGASVQSRRIGRERIQDFGHDNRIGLLTGSIIPAQVYYKAQKLRTMLRQQILDA
ncbi:MAG: hypothetical protein Ct9H300mP11_24160 [Chloroflexota bacterium]|nr:MAG: hypothetical protein Ct9H300mP11_24160 [Chloroflexota bacterium]